MRVVIYEEHPDQCRPSNSHVSGNGVDYGDYTNVAFDADTAHATWPDNSNSTGNNPDGTLHQLDIYAASVPFPATH